ncbi:hypothetical protein DL93DRAFT_2164731 [Clavulina sp. PMI_390]|nr:hypothetical protein DL93DRAFT_2164731 [Clavulina sp. PMI_390]
MSLSSTILGHHDDISRVYKVGAHQSHSQLDPKTLVPMLFWKAWKLAPGPPHEVLTDDFRWRSAMYICTRRVFAYPLMERYQGPEAVQKDRDLFASASDLIRQLDTHIEVYDPAHPIERTKHRAVDTPAADPVVEKLMEALLPAFAQAEKDLPAFESALSPEERSQLFRPFDIMRTFWTLNTATPWPLRTYPLKDGAEMLDKPVGELMKVYGASLSKHDM